MVWTYKIKGTLPLYLTPRGIKCKIEHEWSEEKNEDLRIIQM